jgi:hypothetical protein
MDDLRCGVGIVAIGRRDGQNVEDIDVAGNSHGWFL